MHCEIGYSTDQMQDRSEYNIKYSIKIQLTESNNYTLHTGVKPTTGIYEMIINSHRKWISTAEILRMSISSYNHIVFLTVYCIIWQQIVVNN